MKNRLLLTASLGLFLCLTGCQSAKVRNLKGELKAGGAGFTGSQADVYNFRSKEIVDLETQFEKSEKAYEKQYSKLCQQAQLFGVSAVAFGWAGLGAGIAASALVVASPANVVWVAGLSSFAGGAGLFSSVAGEQGFTKYAVAQAMIPVVGEHANAYTNFSTAKLRELLYANAPSAEFDAEMKVQEGYAAIIRVDAQTLQSPGGASAPSSTSGTTPALAANFTSAPGAAAHQVVFTDTSTGTPNGWIWDFGDHTPAQAQTSKASISHTYANAGTYAVSLVITGAATSSTKSMPVTVR
jgi:PKD repeat protein